MATTEASAKVHHRGMWHIPYKATNVLCSDGKRRTVRLCGEADTAFSMPGSVQVKGKTVSGFITDRGYEYPGDIQFIAYAYRKNGYLLP